MIGAANAQQVPLLNPYGPTGGTAITSKAISEDLGKKGYNFDVKMLPNCVLFKQVWDNSDKAVAVRDTTVNAGLIAGCDVPTTKDNFVFISNISPMFLCNTGNGKTLDDFRKPGASWTVGEASIFPKYITDKVAKENKNTLKTVLYLTANDVAAAAKAGELDFVWANGNWPELQLNGKCFAATGINDVPGMVRATAVWPNVPELKLTYGWWVIAKGYKTDELAKLKKDIRDAWEKDPVWTELRKKRNFIDAYVDKLTDQQAMEIIDRDRAIWQQTKQ